jgi:hypothetical protein
VHTVWHPLVEWTRLRHLRFRKKLARLPLAGVAPEAAPNVMPGMVVSAGV